MRCLTCGLEMKPTFNNETQPNGGGEIIVRFDYGSRYDQCGGINKHLEPLDRIHLLLNSDKIRAYICDDCFKEKIHLFEGWTKEQPRPEAKTVPQTQMEFMIDGS